MTGAQIREENGVLEATLEGDLKVLFGQPVLRMVFDPHLVTEDTELVCHGSYVLNAIHQYLQTRGYKTVTRLNEKYQADPSELRRQIKVQNGVVTQIRIKKVKTVDLIYNFKASFLSDEKSELIYRIGIDRHGSIFDARLHYPEDLSGMEMTSLAQLGEADVSRKMVEASFRECLKTAAEQAKAHARTIQNDIFKRLHRNIARIKGYYTAQIEELHRQQAGYEEKRLAIEREYQHKLNEEINNHRLRIVLKLINMQIVSRTETEVHLRLRSPDNPNEQPYQLLFDNFSGELDYGNCPMCQVTMDTIVLTHDRHIACARCAYVCKHCGKINGHSSRGNECHICRERLCPECSVLCVDCRQPACNHHADLCAIGNEWVCSACAHHCDVCQKTLCREHTFICAQTGKPLCYEHRFICPHCRKIFSHSLLKKNTKGNKCPWCKEKL